MAADQPGVPFRNTWPKEILEKPGLFLRGSIHVQVNAPIRKHGRDERPIPGTLYPNMWGQSVVNGNVPRP